ncbi:hypothetical protein Tco_0039996 [Tanacetum coccineum]
MSVFSCTLYDRYRCRPTRVCKVKFATGTLIKEALSWWNSFAQPIGIEEAYKITWAKFKKLLIKKYCPRTEVQKMEEPEFYNWAVKGNEFSRTICEKDSRNGNLCVPLWCRDRFWKMLEVSSGDLPRSIELAMFTAFFKP